MKFLRSLALLLAPLLLTGCLLIPGAFEAEMTIDRQGAFTFAYSGEIRVEPGDEGDGAKPAPPDEDGSANGDFNAAMNQGFEEMAQQLMGGLNLRDEESVRAFAEALERREGWERVAYRGAGVFDVEYAVSGTLTHDFAFPVMPEMMLNFPMFTAVRRDDGTIAIKALAMMQPPDGQQGSDEDRPQGTFTLRTDAEIVESSVAASQDAGRSLLRWDTEAGLAETPSAVIRLGA